MMKKFILSSGTVLIFVFYIIYQRHFAATPELPALTKDSSNISVSDQTPSADISKPASSAPPVSISPAKPAVSAPPAKPPIKPAGQYKDGQFTGTAADAFYGNVQVRAIISGGKLTDVQFLQYPNDRRQSQEISAMSLPQLKQEAIAAQNAQVHAISGATQTSGAFVQSLASALGQAK